MQIDLHTTGAFLSLDADFIENYMPDAVPVYSLLYIYTLNCCQSGARVSALKLSEIFRITKSEVLDAWRYWQSVGLVELATAKEEIEEIASIKFLPVRAVPESVQAVQAVPFMPPAVSLPVTERPKYSVEELTLYKNQSEDIARLFGHAEKTMAKMLTYNDLNILFGFHDWLRMPVDLIVFMLDYCAQNARTDLRYMEKVALDWAERGIKTVTDAANYTATFDKKYRTVMAALGAANAFPSPTQRKYMDKWLFEWQMVPEMIADACDKTAVQIGKPKLTYVDKILGRWYKEGIKTAAQAETDAENFAAKHSQKFSEPQPGIKRPRRNRFANFKSRERDYEQLERQEREYQIKRLQAQGVKI